MSGLTSVQQYRLEHIARCTCCGSWEVISDAELKDARRGRTAGTDPLRAHRPTPGNGGHRMKPYYEDESVTLYHGDCREITAWLDADVLVTDPPYGVRWESKFGDNRGPRRNRSRAVDVIANDDSTDARDEALAMWGERPAIVFGSWRMPRPARLHALLIWHKEGAYSALSRSPFFTNHEEIYALGSTWPMPEKPLRSVLTTTEHRSQHTAKIGHPTPKPTTRPPRTTPPRCGWASAYPN